MMSIIFAGLTTGAIYAIVGVGYNLVYIASRVFNFAQAQFVVVGMFVGYVVGVALDWPLWAAILASAVAGGIIGALEEVLAIRRLVGKGAHNELVTTLGVGTIISGIALVLFGADAQRVPFFAGVQPFDLAGGRISLSDVLIIASALVLAIGVGLITQKTSFGLASLATSEDRDASKLRGVNVKSLGFWAFVIAGALVAATGPIIADRTFVLYSIGDLLAVKAFVALAIGGFGSYLGALIGGFAVGLLELLFAWLWGAQFQNIGVFVLLLIVLLVLPQGIFGKKMARVV